MSISILRQTEAKTQARHFTYALMKEIAFHHHDGLGYAFPSLGYLAQKLRVSVRTIQRHLGKLEAMGELIVARVRGRGLNNRYYLKLLGFEPPPEKKVTRWQTLKAILGWKNMTAMSHELDKATTNQTTPVNNNLEGERLEQRNPLWCEACHVIHQGDCDSWRARP
jgi:DNA-binding transcriptional MocR family regulator